jgi:hypothetical protein
MLSPLKARRRGTVGAIGLDDRTTNSTTKSAIVKSGELLVKWAARIRRHRRGYQRTVHGQLNRLEIQVKSAVRDTQAEEQAIENAQLRTARDAYDRQRAL